MDGNDACFEENILLKRHIIGYTRYLKVNWQNTKLENWKVLNITLGSATQALGPQIKNALINL